MFLIWSRHTVSMPIHDPEIHDRIVIDPRALDFVQALVNIDSGTFGNYYKSGIIAGYKPSYCRVIGHHFPKCRIKRVIKTMQNPFAQAVAKRMREESGEDYQPSKRAVKRMKAEQNRQFNEFKLEWDASIDSQDEHLM